MALNRRDANKIASTLSQNGQNVQFLYNGGDAIFTDDYRPPGNMLVYNAPGSSVTYVSGSNGCVPCHIRLSSWADVDNYRVTNSKCYSQHNINIESWSDHVNRYSHTRCRIPNCAKSGVDFGSDARSMQHFRNKHQGEAR